MSRVLRLLVMVGLAVVLALAAACGGDEDDAAPAGGIGTGSATTAPEGFDAVLAEARGQTVRWWMFGGDARINAYLADHVIPAAAERGVTLEQVPIDDTAEVVQRVLSEREAGRDSGGAVDLIWINGENFALGKEQGLWLEDWAGSLPNAALLDPADESLTTDFGVPTEGQESPWSRAALVFAHDPARTPEPPATVAGFLDYARANPGRVTFPAPPDFTGSAFLRLAVQELGEDEALEALRDIRPFLFDEGRSQPKDEAELNQLFGDGQLDLAMSYDPGFVQSGVRNGVFPESTRPYAMERTLVNVSFVVIPANASNPAGARVVADLLLSPELQAIKADPAVLGIPTVLDLGRLDDGQRALFDAAEPSPYLIGPEDFGELVPELAASEVTRLEERYRREVLR
ncbi:MAG: ABC transporter substrate-binding protein [Miltoncostaeaceae bacterium]